ncbi:hypothetical protein CpipJ_CPIJ014318, partial [Culex quinquefasciatus]
ACGELLIDQSGLGGKFAKKIQVVNKGKRKKSEMCLASRKQFNIVAS